MSNRRAPLGYHALGGAAYARKVAERTPHKLCGLCLLRLGLGHKIVARLLGTHAPITVYAWKREAGIARTPRRTGACADGLGAGAHKTSPHSRVADSMRTRVRHALQGNIKSTGTMTLVGCSAIELKQYIEARFKRGMTWDNYGSDWHIDHIVPCASFDLTDPKQQRLCFHFTNLQPLWADDNIRKHARVTNGQLSLCV